MKVMVGIRLCIRVVVEFTTYTFLKCLFFVEAEEPPPAKPPAMVSITPHTEVPKRPSLSLYRFGNLKRLLLEDHCLVPLSSNSFWESVDFCPTQISSSILSFNAIHSSMFMPIVMVIATVFAGVSIPRCWDLLECLMERSLDALLQ